MEIKVPAGTSFPHFHHHHHQKKKKKATQKQQQQKNGELSVIFVENLLQLSLSSQ